mgnify:CR=1 FL=1
MRPLFAAVFALILITTFAKAVPAADILYPATSADPLQSIPGCELIEHRTKLVTSQRTARIFANVQKIYLIASPDAPTVDTLQAFPFLEDVRFENLAACTLQEVIGTKNENGKKVPKKPITIVHKLDEIDNWGKSLDRGSLVIAVTLDLSVGWLKGYGGDKLITLHTRYFRPDVNDIRSANQGCAQPVAYSSDSKIFQHRLAKAMYSCLNRKYSTEAE